MIAMMARSKMMRFGKGFNNVDLYTRAHMLHHVICAARTHVMLADITNSQTKCFFETTTIDACNFVIYKIHVFLACCVFTSPHWLPYSYAATAHSMDSPLAGPNTCHAAAPRSAHSTAHRAGKRRCASANYTTRKIRLCSSTMNSPVGVQTHTHKASLKSVPHKKTKRSNKAVLVSHELPLR